MEFSDQEIEVLRTWMDSCIAERGADAFGFRGIDDQLVADVAMRLAADEDHRRDLAVLIQRYRRDAERLGRSDD